MTGFIGGSLLLIIASAFALFFGWISADPNLIWVSIVASGLSAVLLALGYGKSREEIDRAVAIAMRKAGIDPAAQPRKGAGPKPRPTLPADPVARPGSVGGVKPAAAAASALEAAPLSETASMPAVDEGGSRQVVAIPARKRYHRPECRFSASKGAQTVSLAAAQRRGYDACGVCKP